jgi:pimeloyl-ACP methyl ester carboxylesterase
MTSHVIDGMPGAPYDAVRTSAPNFDDGAYGMWGRRELDVAPHGRIAWLEQGAGQVALFLHGFPLNAWQWRGVLERLAPHRRCIAPDFMGLGYSEVPDGTDLSPMAQARMLMALLDRLGVGRVDLVANDSGGAIAQLVAATWPERVRTLLLSNCDVHTNCPPPALAPMIAAAHAGVLADQFIQRNLDEPGFAQGAEGLGGLAYTRPHELSDETVAHYFAPLVSSPLRKAQFHQYLLALEANPLLAVEPALRSFWRPVRMVWGSADPLFPLEWAYWLDRLFIRSQGVRVVPGARLFFPEEEPDLVAEEALSLWTHDAGVLVGG